MGINSDILEKNREAGKEFDSWLCPCQSWDRQRTVIRKIIETRLPTNWADTIKYDYATEKEFLSTRICTLEKMRAVFSFRTNLILTLGAVKSAPFNMIIRALDSEFKDLDEAIKKNIKLTKQKNHSVPTPQVSLSKQEKIDEKHLLVYQIIEKYIRSLECADYVKKDTLYSEVTDLSSLICYDKDDTLIFGGFVLQKPDHKLISQYFESEFHSHSIMCSCEIVGPTVSKFCLSCGQRRGV